MWTKHINLTSIILTKVASILLFTVLSLRWRIVESITYRKNDFNCLCWVYVRRIYVSDTVVYREVSVGVMKYELRTMRNEEIVAELYAFFLSISTNHCLILPGNNSNTLSCPLSCSELNWNKCGSELPTLQKTVRRTGSQLISKVLTLETVTLSVTANFRHKTLLQHSLVSICLSVTGVWTVPAASYTCVLVRVEVLTATLKHGTPTPLWRHSFSLDISVLNTYITLCGKYR
jgi:hypothetical protein